MSSPGEILKRTFGFDSFRGVQEQVIGRVMAGQHTLAVMPTGAGKSLCYQLPALARDGTAIVISPLIALMHDQIRAADAIGIRAASLTSADSDRERTIERFRAGELDLLYAAPERATTDGFRRLLIATCRWRCSRSTKRIASANGGTISAPITGCCGRCSTAWPMCRAWR